MSTINSIQGRSDPEIARRAEKSTPQKEIQKPEFSNTDAANPLMPRGVEDVLPKARNAPTEREAPSYTETREVADKLQTRIDEIASEPHQVAIRNIEETKAFVIEIKNPDGEVVKQFPPEKVLNLRDKMDDLSGMVIDEMI